MKVSGIGVDSRRRMILLGVLGHYVLGVAACNDAAPDGAGSDGPTQGSPPPSGSMPQFPLQAAPGGRYLQDAVGRAFLIHGDTAWSIVAQLSDEEIDTYLNNRQGKGFNTVLFSAPEAYYTSQSPPYLNVDGVAPFSPMTDFGSPNEAYWRRVDRIVNGARARGMVCILNPAYLGYPSGRDGWAAAVSRTPVRDLQVYGAFLGNRFSQGNVIWCLGGDRDGDAALLEKQWGIVTGLRSVRPNDLVTAHPLADRTNADDAFAYWRGYPGFALNAIYGYETSGFFVHDLAAQAYARPGPMPFIGFEFKYENSAGADAAMLRRQSYGSILCGACGQIFGNLPIWHFESPNWSETYSGSWQSNLDSVGSVEQQHVIELFSSFEWWKLEPRPDTSLVTTDLGHAANRLYPALAHDGSFAMIYVPGARSVSVDLSMLSPMHVRARTYDPTRGTYSPIVETPFANAGSIMISTGGECVIVLDAHI